MADLATAANPPTGAPLGGLAGRLGRLAGWRRWLTAAALGALAAVAMPPAWAVPVLLVAFPGLLWLLDGAHTTRTAFWTGWWFGFGYFGIGLYWISFALFVDLARFWWMVPFAVTGLPAFFALYIGAAAALHHRLRWPGVAGVLLFALLWAAAEWLRGHLLTGFPWQLAGHAWGGTLEVLQLASLVGIYGLSLVTVAVAVLPALFGLPGVGWRRSAAACAVGAAVLAGVAGWGALRLADHPTRPVPGVGLRLVQASIDQTLKWAPDQVDTNFRRHLELSAGAPPAPGERLLVIWPETAVGFFPEQDPRRRAILGAVLPPGGLALIGAPRISFPAEPGGGGEERAFWNSLLVVDGRGTVVTAYDKAHLVPFGEYLPLRHWLPEWLPLRAVAAGSADFSAGPGPQTLALDGLPPLSALICYEGIFPAEVTDGTGRAAWLLNVTNDAWYGRSAGPHQHFAIAAVRAVEEGLPLVRVANTGISGVVDPVGRVVARLELGQSGRLDAALPERIEGRTLYSVWGDLAFLALMITLSAVCLFSRYVR